MTRAPTPHGNSRPSTDCGGFTAGPWQAETAYEKEPRYGVFIPNEPRVPICRVKSAADARLISAAPDLLEALQALVPVKGISTANRNIPDDTVVPCDVMMGDLRRAAAAISKALGESTHD